MVTDELVPPPSAHLSGFNDNVPYKGRVYHVQTEDSGVACPHISTHVFCQGTIVGSLESRYDELLGAADLRHSLTQRMRAQQEEAIAGLFDGRYDERIRLTFGAAAAAVDTPRDAVARPNNEVIARGTVDDVVLEHVLRFTELDAVSWSSAPPPSTGRPLSTRPPPSLEGALVDGRIDPDCVVPIARRIEALGASACGALRFERGGEHVGDILVERGRVCWAAAERMAARLTDILRGLTSPPLEQDAIEWTYARCRESGQPLGEALIEAGMITAAALERAIRQHTAEALVRLALSGARAEFTPHARRGYQARFTIAPAHLLAVAGELRNRPLAAAARAELERRLPAEATGVAVARAGGHRLMHLALFRPGALTVDDIDGLGRAAAGGLDVAQLLDPARRVVMTRSWHGDALVAWSAGPLMFAALCFEASSTSFVLATLSRGR